jgi:hypothetical protein
MHSLSVELGSQSEFRDAAEVKHGWKKNTFHCLLIFGQADR